MISTVLSAVVVVVVVVVAVETSSHARLPLLLASLSLSPLLPSPLPSGQDQRSVRGSGGGSTVEVRSSAVAAAIQTV